MVDDATLSAPADNDESEDAPLSDAQALEWAAVFLPEESAEAFVDWLMGCWGDWAGGTDLTVLEVLTGALGHWRGDDFPDPPRPS